MMGMALIIPALLLIALAGAVGYVLGRGAAQQSGADAAAVQEARRETASLRALVDRLKELAWDHRELDSALSTIVIDEIRTHEKKELGP